MALTGKHVLVIGGSSGIGFGVARAALAEGARVTVASSNAARVEDAVRRLGGGREAVVGGAVIDAGSEAAIAQHFARGEPVDHIVFTAADWGQVAHVDFDQLDFAAAGTIFNVRFWGAMAVARHAVKCLPPGGSITLTNGMAAHRPQKGLVVSTAMAGAVEHLVKGLAVELAPIRVNGVCPGAIRTEAWDELPPEFRKVQEDRLAGQPIGRVGTVPECAEAYLYLMKAGYTTGQVLRVEGGWTLQG